MPTTLQEISAKYCKKQPHQIDHILEGAPLLARMNFVPSTHGLWHSYEKLREVDSASFVNIDQALPEADVTAETDLKQLNIMGFRMTIGTDKLALGYGKGNFAAYLARKSPKVMTASGMALEKSLFNIYKKYAARNNKLASAGGTGDDVKTILILRFVDDENCGLYDEDGFGNGAMFDTTMLSGGNPYVNDKGVSVYGADFKSYLGILCENPDAVAGITNISDANPLTAKMINDALIKAKAGSIGTTLIVGHPTALEYIYALKNGFTTTGNSINTKVADWDGIEILPTWNFPGSEEAMTTLTDNSTDPLSLSGKETLVNGENFFEGQKLGADAVTSRVLHLTKGAVNSSILIRGKVKEAMTLAEDVTVTLEHSNKKNGTFKTIHSVTLAKDAAAGTEFMEFVLPPSFAGYARVTISAADANAAGTVDIYPTFIPR